MAFLFVACAATAASADDGGLVLVSSRGRVVFPPSEAPVEVESPSSIGRMGEGRDDSLVRVGGDDRVATTSLLLPARAYIGQESILGSDDRKKVKETTEYPARAVVLVTFGHLRCSGSLVGPDTVLTAGHCVFDHGADSFYDVTTYRVYPGRDGDRSPFGSCGVQDSFTNSAYIADADDRFDFGLLHLDCAIGDDVGWFGLYSKHGSVRKTPVRINGYPGDKPLTQWKSLGSVIVSEPRRVFYRNDTTAGTSGSGVYFYGSRQCDPCILGVHAYGVYGEPPFSQNNHAARVTPEVVEMIMEVAGH